jgi:L-threonylcarbamoyladenylate synthase
VDPDLPDLAALEPAAALLRDGGLVAFPTETVYGLGANALDPAAVARIFDVKGRPANDPLIVHVATTGDLAPLAEHVPDAALSLADRFWPGPLTLVMRRSPLVHDAVTAGLATVAVRIPAHPVARALIAAARVPVVAPSANLFSRPSPTTAAHVLEDLEGRIDLVIDAGPTSVGVESTVLDLSGPVPLVLRPGAVTKEMLLGVLPRVDERHEASSGTAAMPSPGMLSRHYSPRASLTLYEGAPAAVARRMTADASGLLAKGRRVGVIVADEDEVGAGHVVRIGPLARPDIVASRLYGALRELDAAGVDVVLARQFPSDEGLGRALRDRLSRAAAGRVVDCDR